MAGGQRGHDRRGGKAGTQIAGETVDLTLAADGMLTSAMARESVSLDLPAVADTAAQHHAQSAGRNGQPGKD
jgi:hypothetical protein